MAVDGAAIEPEWHPTGPLADVNPVYDFDSKLSWPKYSSVHPLEAAKSQTPAYMTPWRTVYKDRDIPRPPMGGGGAAYLEAASQSATADPHTFREIGRKVVGGIRAAAETVGGVAVAIVLAPFLSDEEDVYLSGADMIERR